jgi:hypothetical protein
VKFDNDKAISFHILNVVLEMRVKIWEKWIKTAPLRATVSSSQKRKETAYKTKLITAYLL